MTTIVTIDATDTITSSRADLNTNFANLNSDKIETSVIDTDTTLAANSDDKIPSQKAVKAYIDAGGSTTFPSDYVTTSAGAADSGKGVKLNAGGRLDVSIPLTGFKPNAGETINGATLPVAVYQNKTDNEVYACDANDATKYKFIGFATTNSTNGNPITVKTTGIVEGFTGLAEGEKYYVQDDKTIGTTPSTTTEILVGIAISETALLIQKGKMRACGAYSTAGTATSAITLGFRPSVIRMTGFSVEPGGGVVAMPSSGSWVNGVYASSYYSWDDGSPAATVGTSTSYILLISKQATDYWQVAITNVTDTGFTISATEANATAGIALNWEAEGEL